MTEISLMEGIEITVVSITVVFLVLIGLMLIIGSFKYIFKEDTVQKTQQTTTQAPGVKVSQENDQEAKKVAAITALIVANEEQQDKNYKITSITRIN